MDTNLITDVKSQNIPTELKQDSTSTWGWFSQPVWGDVRGHMETAKTGLTGLWAKIIK